ncbi:hypothetical protein [Nocardioides panacisoli]|uniref:Calcium-binding protein n=1 Tax=Nocardioides panacisoli TaxID=627624 RepID=A0ABP7I032_9ACTN
MVSRLLARAGVVAVAIVGTTVPVAVADGAHAHDTAVGECSPKHATIVGTDGDDAIVGTPGADVILAKGGDDVVRGGGGRDVICLGEGNDRAHGGTGDDQIVGGAGDDDVSDSGAGFGYIDGGGGADRVTSTGDFELVNGGGGADTLTVTADYGSVVNGGGGDDTVTVSSDTAPQDALWLDGGRGADALSLTLPAAAQRARLNQGSSSIIVFGTSGGLERWETLALSGDIEWTYIGRNVAESLTVDGGTLTALMRGGDDVVQGPTGDDVITGGDGADTLRGGAGDDILDGGASTADELYGEDGNDIGRDADGAAVCDSLELGSCAAPAG